MSVFDDETKKQVSQVLESLGSKVEILAYGEDSDDQWKNINDVLNSLDELSDNVSVSYNSSEAGKASGLEMTPAIEIKGKNKGRIIFYGIPAGYEFGSLIESIRIAADEHVHITEDTKKFISDYKEKLDFKVFVTPTCPYCPGSVILAHAFALLNDNVTAAMVEATEFPELSNKHNVSGVPHTIVNDGKTEWVGAQPEDEVLKKLKEL